MEKLACSDWDKLPLIEKARLRNRLTIVKPTFTEIQKPKKIKDNTGISKRTIKKLKL